MTLVTGHNEIQHVSLLFYPQKRGHTNSRCRVAGPTKFWKLLLLLVGLQGEIRLMSDLWHLELYGGSYIFRKFVYPWCKGLIAPTGTGNTPVRPTLQYQTLGRLT